MLYLYYLATILTSAALIAGASQLGMRNKARKSNNEVLGGCSFLKRQRLQWRKDRCSSAAVDRSECKANYPNSSKIMCYNSRLWLSAWAGFLSEMPLLAEAMEMVAKGFWNASQHSCITASAEEIQRVIVSGTWQALVHGMGGGDVAEVFIIFEMDFSY